MFRLLFVTTLLLSTNTFGQQQLLPQYNFHEGKWELYGVESGRANLAPTNYPSLYTNDANVLQTLSDSLNTLKHLGTMAWYGTLPRYKFFLLHNGEEVGWLYINPTDRTIHFTTNAQKEYEFSRVAFFQHRTFLDWFKQLMDPIAHTQLAFNDEATMLKAEDKIAQQGTFVLNESNHYMYLNSKFGGSFVVEVSDNTTYLQIFHRLLPSPLIQQYGDNIYAKEVSPQQLLVRIYASKSVYEQFELYPIREPWQPMLPHSLDVLGLPCINAQQVLPMPHTCIEY